MAYMRVAEMSWKTTSKYSFLFIVGIFFSIPIQASTLSINTIDDGFIEPNYGTVDTISTISQTSKSGPAVAKRSIYEFDLSSIPDSATLVSATMSVFSTFAYGTGQVDFYAYSGDGTVTLNDYSAPAVQVGSFLYPLGWNRLPDGVKEITFDLAAMQNIFNNSNYLTIRTQGNGGLYFDVATLENGTYPAASININYTAPTVVPLPGTALMFIPALLGFMFFGLRRSKEFMV
jgi:hypothetical protein